MYIPTFSYNFAGKRIQNDYTETSYITTIFADYRICNTHFRLQKKDMSLKLNEPRNIRGVVSYKRSFPDLNDKHLEAAKLLVSVRWKTAKQRKI